MWFECKVRYKKTLENGGTKNANDPYLVDALSFTEAETRFIEMISPYMSGDFSITAVKKTRVNEIFFNETGDRYYMVKAMFVQLDESKGVEKRSPSYILVQASDFRDALEKFEEGMKGTLADYEIASITETAIMDVYPLNAEPHVD